ncbi:hypothetical protein ZWY2020_039667 [Hordeum vulgare]|nr:hypothetical protein ZWY2020_039667 [Hordeum vulgare]
MEKSSFASASSGELTAAVYGAGRPVRVIPLRHPLDAAVREAAAASSPSLLSAAMERARGMGPWEWAEAALRAWRGCVPTDGRRTSRPISPPASLSASCLCLSVTRSSKIIPLIESIIAGIDQFSWPPFVMGSAFLVILLIMKKLGKTNKNLRFLRASGPLTAVVLGTLFVKIFRPPAISVVGEIPQGLPSFSIPRGFEHLMSLMPTAILITGVAILESVGIAKALAAKNGYELDSNKELFGLGLSNICGSFFSAYPATGSFSRSAVNHESGAKTGLSGIIMGIIICSALLFMTPLFTDIPQCALAAIVISAVTGLVDYEEAIFLWGIDKKDFFLWAMTFITTLTFGIEIGVLVGVGFSLAFVIHESANPHIAVLGRLPGTTVYRNTLQYPEAYTYNGIVVVRVDAPIYFANISYIKDRLRECLLLRIDSSAVQALKDLHQEYKARDIQIAIANPNRQVHLLLSRAGIIDMIGAGWCFVRVHDAVQVCLQHVQSSSSNAIKLSPQASGHLTESPKKAAVWLPEEPLESTRWNGSAGDEAQSLLRQNLV